MLTGWEVYITHLTGMWSGKKKEWLRTNVVKHAAIYGLDGKCWGSNKEWPGLNEYQHDLEEQDGTTSKVAVNEFNIAMEVAKGNRNPSQAGVRMGNNKFMMTTFNEDVSYLSCRGGGACVTKTNKAIIIAMWDKDTIMSNNNMQNAGDCNMLVERMAEFLKKEGF